MQKFTAKPLSYCCALLACTIMSLTTACASGGFKLTREYAGFVNRQQIIVRIILYILTAVVFAATMLIDMVIFNTMDFWEGRVSAGDYQFQQGDKTYQAHHEVLPGTKLKRSLIKVLDQNKKQLQEIALTEMPNGEIEVKVDGKLRGRVHGISEVPVASIYGKDGKWLEDRIIPQDNAVASAREAALNM